MGIPKITCEKCGYVYSVSIREALNDKGIRESYLAIDPSHINCLGGYEMKADIRKELKDILTSLHLTPDPTGWNDRQLQGALKILEGEE